MRRTCVGFAAATKIVSKRRTVVTFYISYYKSVNRHIDRGVVVAKPRTVVTLGERRGERRDEKREVRREKRGAKR